LAKPLHSGAAGLLQGALHTASSLAGDHGPLPTPLQRSRADPGEKARAVERAAHDCRESPGGLLRQPLSVLSEERFERLSQLIACLVEGLLNTPEAAAVRDGLL